jgi:non-specific serine/threonine protein kinase
VPATGVLGCLGALVDKSLVQFDGTGAGPARYRLLETVRQYAAGQLDAQGPAVADSARIAHRDHYLALAEAAAPHLEEPDQAVWLERLDAELGNLRAALAVSKARPDPEPGLRLATSLRLYWRARGYAAEGAGVLRALLDLPAAQQATLPRARALAAAAGLLDRTGDYATAGDYCEEALAIARATGDDHLLAELLYLRSLALLRQGQAAAALPMIERGLDLARPLEKPHLTACLLWTRSYAAAREGDPAGAARDAAESLELFRLAGDQLQVDAVLGVLGYYQLLAGDLSAARRHLAEALEAARALGAHSDMVYGTVNLGFAEYLGGSPGAAEPLFAESLDLAMRTGMKASVAYALIGLAMTGHGGAGPGWSARLHGAADQALADVGETIDPLEGRLAALDRQRLRAVIGAEAFDVEYGIGRALDLARVLGGLGGTGQAAGQARAAHRARSAAQAGRGGALAREPGAAAPGRAAPVLTPRELEVLTLVAQGLSNPDIGQRLMLSEHTVHRHLANILRKLGLPSRVAAAAWGARNGLV